MGAEESKPRFTIPPNWSKYCQGSQVWCVGFRDALCKANQKYRTYGDVLGQIKSKYPNYGYNSSVDCTGKPPADTERSSTLIMAAIMVGVTIALIALALVVYCFFLKGGKSGGKGKKGSVGGSGGEANKKGSSRHHSKAKAGSALKLNKKASAAAAAGSKKNQANSFSKKKGSISTRYVTTKISRKNQKWIETLHWDNKNGFICFIW